MKVWSVLIVEKTIIYPEMGSVENVHSLAILINIIILTYTLMKTTCKDNLS